MNQATVRIGDQFVGDGHPVFVVAEIGINHNGSLDLARRLIDGAVLAGADAVKFQKRTPEICVPRDQWNIMRETPWGPMTLHRLPAQARVRRRASTRPSTGTAADRGILWFASCWDEEAVDFMEQFDPPAYKAASASLTDHALLRKMKDTGRPLILSTGMSTWDEVEGGGRRRWEPTGCSSPTPSRPIPARSTSSTSRSSTPSRRAGPRCPSATRATRPDCRRPGRRWPSARRTSSATSRWTARCGAAIRPRRWRSAASSGWSTDIRDIERSLGDGVKRFHDSELAQKKKLRRVQSAPPVAAALARP